MEPIRVVIADDDAGMRLIERKMIERVEGYELVGEAADGDALLSLVEKLRPQVVFLDVDMPGRDGVACARAIQDMDFVKYHVFPKGYMIRTSTESSREQVRISKEAVKNGVSFERIGADFIRQYKKNINILNVKMLFITAPDADYAGAKKLAKNVKDITMSLTKILEGMPTDCGSCQLKPICDEVEGMKELHFGKEGMKKMGKKFLDDVLQGGLHYQMLDSFKALDTNFWDGCSELPSLVIINMSYFFSNVTAQFTERLAIQISEVMKKYPLNRYLFFIQHSEFDKKLNSYRVFRHVLAPQSVVIKSENSSFSYILNYNERTLPFCYDIFNGK